MIIVSFIIAFVIQIGLPIVLGFWLSRRYGLSWKLFGVGVLTFIGSQVVHLPLVGGFNALARSQPGFTLGLPVPVYYALALGLLAGLCEETARWVGYRLLKNRAATYDSSLMVGAGHGGVESILVGLTVLSQTVMMVIAGPTGGNFSEPLRSNLVQIWNLPWHLPLAGGVERIMAVILHLSLSVMVWLAVTRRSFLWYLAAVLWHAAVDAVVVYLALPAAQSVLGMGIWGIEGVMAVFTLLNLAWLWASWRLLHSEAKPAVLEEVTAPVPVE